MLRYSFRRLGSALLVFVASTFTMHGLLTLIRDDLVRTAIRRSCGCGPEEVAALAEPTGINRTIAGRYVDWLTSALQGDFGVSRRFGEPVVDVVWPAAGRTFAYVIPALLLVIAGSVMISLWSATHWHSRSDHAVSIAGLFLFAAPPFLIPLVIQLFWGIWWPDWTGTRPFQVTGIDIVNPSQIPALLVFPVTSLVIIGISADLRFGRFAFREKTQSDFLITARAKGASERRIVYRHLLPAGLATVAPLWGLSLAVMLGGSFFVETIFGIRGLGTLTLDAINAREINVVLGTTTVMAFAVTIANLIADLATARFDPRITLT